MADEKKRIIDLPSFSTLASGQKIPVDGDTSGTGQVDYNLLAKAIIEQYNASTLAGSAQSVKNALDALNQDTTSLKNIHELSTFEGTPSGTDYLVIDNGTVLKKISALDVYPTATQADIETGTSTTPSVITSEVFNDSTKAIVTQSYIKELLEDGDSLLSATTKSQWQDIYGEAINQIIDKAMNNLAQVAIVESGTSDAWTWRKYSDGTADLWLNYKESSATAFSPVERVYYRTISGFNFPFQFTERPIVTLTIGMANVGAGEFTALTTQSMSVIIISASASARDVTINAHIYGKWR